MPPLHCVGYRLCTIRHQHSPTTERLGRKSYSKGCPPGSPTRHSTRVRVLSLLLQGKNHGVRRRGSALWSVKKISVRPAGQDERWISLEVRAQDVWHKLSFLLPRGSWPKGLQIMWTLLAFDMGALHPEGRNKLWSSEERDGECTSTKDNPLDLSFAYRYYNKWVLI